MDSVDRLRRAVTAVVCLVAVMAAADGCGVWQDSSTPRVVSRGCPSVIPGTSSATEDFADLLVWGGRTYVAADSAVPASYARPVRLEAGANIGSVTCSLVDGPLGARQERLVNLPWPDGTATSLSQGTTIFAVAGQPTRCVLAAHRDAELVGYVAIDTGDNKWPTLC